MHLADAAGTVYNIGGGYGVVIMEAHDVHLVGGSGDDCGNDGGDVSDVDGWVILVVMVVMLWWSDVVSGDGGILVVVMMNG